MVLSFSIAFVLQRDHCPSVANALNHGKNKKIVVDKIEKLGNNLYNLVLTKYNGISLNIGSKSLLNH